MHRTGRVGRDKLDIHRLARTDGRHAIAVLLVRDDGQFISPCLVGQPDIYEARAGNVRGSDILQLGEPVRQFFSERTRMRAAEFCQDHRRVGRQIAMCRVARPFHGQSRPLEARRKILRQLQIVNSPREMIKEARMKRHGHQRSPTGRRLLPNLHAFPEGDIIPDGFGDRIRIGV